MQVQESEGREPKPTIRLKFARHAVAAGVAYEPGDEADLPEDLAAYYLAERSADQVPAKPRKGG